MTNQPTRIVLADDHPMLREGLARSLSGQGYEIVGEAGDGAAAVDMAIAESPDLVLMDVTMPVLGGIEATTRLLQRQPDAKVVMLTMHSDPELARKALDAGALGYLVKDCTIADIVEAIDAALAGEPTFPDDIDSAPEDEHGKSRIISAREAEVLQLIANGKTTTEAARELYVSAKTVKNHLGSAYAKLDAHDRTQAVLTAARLGLITLDQGK